MKKKKIRPKKIEYKWIGNSSKKKKIKLEKTKTEKIIPENKGIKKTKFSCLFNSLKLKANNNFRD